MLAHFFLFNLKLLSANSLNLDESMTCGLGKGSYSQILSF